MELAQVEKLLNSGVYSVVNRTRSYLAPCLLAYGKDFQKEFIRYSAFGTFIADENHYIDNRCIYCLFNIERSKITNFVDSMMFFRKHKSYIDDYLIGDLLYGKLHMLVLKIPDKHIRSYSKFLKSRYSEMYTVKQINTYLPITKNITERKMSIRSILLKDPQLVINISEEFDVSENFILELDSKLEPEHEIFNHNDLYLKDLIAYEHKRKESLSSKL